MATAKGALQVLDGPSQGKKTWDDAFPVKIWENALPVVSKVNDLVAETSRNFDEISNIANDDWWQIDTDTFIEVQERLEGITESIIQADAEQNKLNSTMDEMKDIAGEAAQNIKAADDSQNELNSTMKKSEGIGGKFWKNMTKEVKTYLSKIFSLENAMKWLKGTMGLYDQQLNAEIRLKTVIENGGGTEEAYQKLKERAEDISKNTTFSDNSLLAGAAQLGTNMQDMGALDKMMGGLANYAAGMSNGSTVDQNKMLEYAGQLSKALEGNLSGTVFNEWLDEGQKKILQTGSEMDKVVVLTEAIEQRWGGLSETIANTPTGKIEQLKNAWEDIQETVGERLYPIVLQFVEILLTHLPFIETLLSGVANVFTAIAEFAGMALEGIMAIGSIFLDNWAPIEPMLWGVVGAMAALQIGTVLMKIAQDGLNLSMLASPLTWIAIIIGVIIFYIAKWVQSVGGLEIAWLIVSNKILTIMDILQLGFMVAIDYIRTRWEELGFAMQSISVRIQNYMDDMRIGVLMSMQNMVNGAIDLINEFIEVVNKIVPVGIEAISHVSFATEAAAFLEAEKAARNDALADRRAELDAAQMQRQHNMEDFAKNSWEARQAREADIQAKQSALTEESEKEDRDGSVDGPGDYLEDYLEDIYGETGNTAGNTAKMAESMDIAEEDLKYLRDIAERETINRFTTAEIRVDMGGITNQIQSNMDIDGIVSYLEDAVYEAMEVAAEGVH